MFCKSNNSIQLSLFSSNNVLLTGKSLNIYEDNHEWHNQFRIQVTNRIDEEIFRPLYREDFGSPNVSIRLLMGMMILKEAQGWSDSQLFEACRFNILVRGALGLMNLDDPVPAQSTYYLLRKRIVDWEKKGNENLIEQVFSQVTKSQAVDFNINGKKIRMDSKLLGSNIAWYSRYELIHETVRKVYRRLKSDIDKFLSESDISFLMDTSLEAGKKVAYRSSKSEIDTRMTQLGLIIHDIINKIDDVTSKPLQTLRRIFNEQYQIVDDVVISRPKEEISATSVQSPHDTDCHYRKKGDNQIKGFSINVTETCDTDAPLNLVTNVLVEAASIADSDFLQPAIEATQDIVLQPVDTVNADGAYHSASNQDYCSNRENPIDLIVGAMPGKPPRYDLTFDENEQLTVKDLQTNTEVPVRQVESRKEDAEPKWAIRTEDGKQRYFTKKDIDTCSIRRQITERTSEELNRRNNVEATIFQTCYHYPNNKSRYRGLIKHKIWANVRCLWVNFVRIFKFIAGGGSKCVQKVKNRLFFTDFLLIFVKTRFDMCLVKNLSLYFSRSRVVTIF